MRDRYEEYKDMLSQKRFEPISYEEMNDLVFKYKETGDEKIKEDIIQRNMRLVIKAVLKINWNTNTDEMMNLICVGNEGLILSLEAYTYDKYDFTYFSYVYILNTIKTYLKRYHPTIQPRQIDKEMFYPTTTDITEEKKYIDNKHNYTDKQSIREDIITLFEDIDVKDRYKEIFLYLHFSEESFTDVGKVFGCTGTRVSQINDLVISKINSDKSILKEFYNLT